MGVVVCARHVELGRDVALKFLCQNEVTDLGEDVRARFRREAKINARLKNEHITRVLDVGTWENSSYIVMERLEGMDLRKRIRSAGGPLPMSVAIDYTLQLCEGLAEAHALGIVHRDLKPGNLFVTRNPDGSELLKIMDFGISKWKGGSIDELTRAGTVLGSPRYMSPEQIFGTGDIDVRADLWSVGAILYEMLADRTPYLESNLTRFCHEVMSGSPPRLDVVAPGVPRPVADVVARCLEREPGRRIASVAELAGALLDAVGRPGTAARAKLQSILEAPATTRTPPVADATEASRMRSPGPSTAVAQTAVVSSRGTRKTTALLRNTLVVATAVVLLGLGGLAMTRPAPPAPAATPPTPSAAPTPSATAPAASSAPPAPPASAAPETSSRPTVAPPTVRPGPMPVRPPKAAQANDDIPAMR
jgi:serine/threonine-protein kinase